MWIALLFACNGGPPVAPPPAPEPPPPPPTSPYDLTGVSCAPPAADAAADALARVGLVCVTTGDLDTGRAAAARAWEAAPEAPLANYALARLSLAQRHRDGHGCDAEAYLDGILRMAGVAATDPALRDKLRTDDLFAEARPALRFRVALGLDLAQEGLADGLVGTRFYSPGAGAYGSTRTLLLLPEGRAELRELTFPDPTASPVWAERSTTWRAEPGALWLGEGEAAVRYDLRADGVLDLAETPLPDFRDVPSECEA
jgi:hypothetical protein